MKNKIPFAVYLIICTAIGYFGVQFYSAMLINMIGVALILTGAAFAITQFISLFLTKKVRPARRVVR